MNNFLALNNVLCCVWNVLKKIVSCFPKVKPVCLKFSICWIWPLHLIYFFWMDLMRGRNLELNIFCSKQPQGQTSIISYSFLSETWGWESQRKSQLSSVTAQELLFDQQRCSWPPSSSIFLTTSAGRHWIPKMQHRINEDKGRMTHCALDSSQPQQWSRHTKKNTGRELC